MRRQAPLLPLLLLLSLISVGASAQAFDQRVGYPPPTLSQPPRSGVGAIVVGAGALGLAALNLVTLPVCYADFYPSSAEDVCVISSLALAGAGVVVGVPSLALGIVRLRRYRAWKQERGLALLEGLTPAVTPHGASLRFTLRF